MAHLGDCRVYRVRHGQLSRTSDHVLARGERGRFLLRAIGLSSNPEVVAWDTRADDVFLLSARIHDVLSDEELVPLLDRSAAPSEALSKLSERAAVRGVKQPWTALVLRV